MVYFWMLSYFLSAISFPTFRRQEEEISVPPCRLDHEQHTKKWLGQDKTNEAFSCFFLCCVVLCCVVLCCVVCLFVCLFVCSFVCLFVGWLVGWLFVCLFVCFFVCLFVCLFVYLLFVCLFSSACLSYPDGKGPDLCQCEIVSCRSSLNCTKQRVLDHTGVCQEGRTASDTQSRGVQHECGTALNYAIHRIWVWSTQPPCWGMEAGTMEAS